MKPVEHRTDAELEFIIADCNAAISANPESANVYRYLSERDQARSELCKREEKRLLRQDLHGLTDPLTIGHAAGISHASRYRVRSGYWESCNERLRYAQKRWRTAAWLLGYDGLRAVRRPS